MSLTDRPILANGRYLVAERLGEGGMATVFRVWDTKLNVWRAIKVLLPSYVSRRKQRARFENEAHAMARIEHPNIIRVYDVGVEGKVPYMVMEIAEGGCIIDWVARYGAMPPRLAVDVTVQICKGIRTAHEEGIVHRDIKPHNVLVSAKGVCKLTDFGIAQVMDQETLTRTGSVMGTWGYMAPEQRTNAKGVDHRADIFAVGATLYTLLTGRTPTELYVAERDDELFENIPDELLDVVLKACRFKPEERYQSAKDLAFAMHKVGSRQPAVPPATPSLILPKSALPNSVEDLDPAPTLVHEFLKAFGREPGDTTAPDTDSEDPTPVEDERKVLPYYMPATNSPVRRSIQPSYGDGLPSYIDSEDYKRTQKARTSTPAPAQLSQEEPEPEPPPVNGMELALKIAIGPVALAAVLFALLVFATYRVNQSESVANLAAFQLYEKLGAQGNLVDTLGRAGADRAALSDRYFDFADAAPEDKSGAAVAYAKELAKAARELHGAAEITNVTGPLQEISDARRAYEAARTEWSATASGFPGLLPVALGLSSAP